MIMSNMSNAKIYMFTHSPIALQSVLCICLEYKSTINNNNSELMNRNVHKELRMEHNIHSTH